MAQTTGFTLWLTGMLGTGKTTMANYLAARLRQVGRPVEVLDEDELAEMMWPGAGDTKEDRATVVQRIGFLASLLTRNNVAVLVAATSPYKAGRDENRRLIGRYLEVYVDCPTETLIQRDSSGKYKKALGGEIPNFIGITEPYERPSSPEITLNSDSESVEDGARRIFQALLDLSFMTTDELKVITGKKMKAGPPKKGSAPKKGNPPKKANPPKKGKAARPSGPAKGTRAAKPASRAARVVKRKAPAKRK